MNRNACALYLVCLISVLLIACTASAKTKATPTEPVNRPTITHLANTPQPSATLPPTIESLATPTSSPSPTPPSPTQTPDLLTFERQASESLSPNRQWVARSAFAFPMNEQQGAFGEQAHVLLKVVNLNTSEEWALVDEWTGYGLGMVTPHVIRWTEDGRYLFFADTGVPDGCGPPLVENLRRADLLEQVIVSMPLDTNAISPDGEKLLVFETDGLGLFDVNTQEVTIIPLEILEGEVWRGEIFWSPDGSSIIFSLLYDQCNPESFAASILQANLIERTSRLLVDQDSRKLRILSWPEQRLALLEDWDGASWWLDVETGSVTPDPPPEYDQAYAAIIDFFESLSTAHYEEAVMHFGGSYTVLQEMNLGVPEDDHTTLWQNACEVNGFQCLIVESAIVQVRPDLNTFIFTVTFLKDGKRYVHGPCCGADIADMPPQWQFTYTVKKDETGSYRVMGLPVWVP